MKESKWQLQEAKNRFSEVVRKASEEGPQFVTKHGKASVVVISMKDYKKRVVPRESLTTFLMNSPLKEENLDLKRDKSPMREIHL